MAYNPIGSGTIADIAAGNLANFMPVLTSKKVLDFVEKNLVAWKCIDTSWEEEFRKMKGDTLTINPLLEISAAAVNVNAAPTAYDTDQGAPTQLIINQWYEAVVGVNDFQSQMGQPDYEKRIIPKLGYAIAKQIDTSVTGLFNAFSQAVGTEGAAVTYDTLLSAKAYLDLADAPEDGRFLIIDPETLTDLMQDDMFTSSLYGGGGAVAKGFIGQSKTLGCTVYVTNNLEAINVNYHGAAMFHREAIGGAMPQPIRYKSWREEDRHTTYHRAEAWWGVVEMRDTFGVWVKTRS
jgi:hypothetical protein